MRYLSAPAHCDRGSPARLLHQGLAHAACCMIADPRCQAAFLSDQSPRLISDSPCIDETIYWRLSPMVAPYTSALGIVMNIQSTVRF